MADDWFRDESHVGERERRHRERADRRQATVRRRRRVLGVGVLAVLVLGTAAVVVAADRLGGGDGGGGEAPVAEAKTVTVTVPEGYNREQGAAVAREAGLRGSYVKRTVSSPYLDPAEYGAEDAESLEGFLFPNTFELEARAPVADLVRLQLEDFKRQIASVDMGYARSKNLTVYDVVTIASMVEEEASLAAERPKIAAVIYNRLRDGIPLGIDATVRYAVGNFDQPLTESELADESPYNTRVNSGLPPGPISSPGLASIEAAARPAKVDFLYYVVEPGTCGKHAFSSDEAQFQEDVARYNQAREEAGGESPTDCG